MSKNKFKDMFSPVALTNVRDPEVPDGTLCNMRNLIVYDGILYNGNGFLVRSHWCLNLDDLWCSEQLPSNYNILLSVSSCLCVMDPGPHAYSWQISLQRHEALAIHQIARICFLDKVHDLALISEPHRFLCYLSTLLHSKSLIPHIEQILASACEQYINSFDRILYNTNLVLCSDNVSQHVEPNLYRLLYAQQSYIKKEIELEEMVEIFIIHATTHLKLGLIPNETPHLHRTIPEQIFKTFFDSYHSALFLFTGICKNIYSCSKDLGRLPADVLKIVFSFLNLRDINMDDSNVEHTRAESEGIEYHKLKLSGDIPEVLCDY